MKKLLFLVITTLLLSGCYKDDIDDLKDDVNELKEQMAQYENLLDALDKRLYVVSYESNDGSYVIKMSDGSELSVRNTSSFIEIGENGNWWIDGVDSGKPAKGDTGADGKAPKITIESNGNWWINGVDTGVSASGQDGKDASEIISISLADGIMTFTFADGRTISMQASVPEISLTEPTEGFSVNQMQWFRLNPEINNTENATYKWLLNGEEIAATSNLLHVFAEPGNYNLEFIAKNMVGENSKTITITVANKTYENKITKVFDFLPAPGQYTNAMPEATPEDTDETMRELVEEKLTAGSMISLGGFGGYVEMGFDHTIINKEGNDFIVLGNAYSSWAEPGIVMVSYDANGNGLPDDEWYEIAGSEHNKPSTIKNYEITYYKPDEEPANANEPKYIRWKDNQGETGYISKNSFHRQSFYPLWKGDSITFKGTYLKSNIYDKSGTGSFWVNPAYEWGYVDNWSNNDEKGEIDISWAINSDGESVDLKGVDFIKVYSANRASGGWLGEVSTEVKGFIDLNLE
ncbi:hypothetical protein EGM88_01820 [Aureibaculum marinum]|uniref:PKD domain-containing protein n=1 Tax=Aureibaculum marinum TaxID=2487930 RepID=A0A3N4NV28_9FLAO|nr:PL29 family lyase N-terminal domain-containing protein [Aureibaculum marinum]RPE00025.1 hypothetical protein EGM88_01820 [Aureibaculum marinum]